MSDGLHLHVGLEASISGGVIATGFAPEFNESSISRRLRPPPGAAKTSSLPSRQNEGHTPSGASRVIMGKSPFEFMPFQREVVSSVSRSVLMAIPHPTSSLKPFERSPYPANTSCSDG